MHRQTFYLAAFVAACMLAACERVPEGPQGGEKSQGIGTGITLHFTNVAMGSRANQATEAGKTSSQERVVTRVEIVSTSAMPEAVFTLTVTALSERACAAAGVFRHVVGDRVYCTFSPTSAPLRVALDGLPCGRAPRTVAALVNIVKPATDANIVALGSWQPSNLFALALSPYRTYFLWGYAQDIHSVTPIATSTWVHLAATYDGRIATLYVNGVAEQERALALDTTAHGVLIGGRGFHGVITDVRVWDSILSAGEIARVAQEALEAVASDTVQRTAATVSADEAQSDATAPGVTAEPPVSRE